MCDQPENATDRITPDPWPGCPSPPGCTIIKIKAKTKRAATKPNQKHFSFSHTRIIYEASVDEDLWLMQRTEALHTSHALLSLSGKWISRWLQLFVAA